VVFGAEPTTAFPVRVGSRAHVVTPARSLPGVVNLVVYGASGATEALANVFTYTAGDRKVVGRTSTQSLLVLGDDALKENA
jgi:hypothetical protein